MRDVALTGVDSQGPVAAVPEDKSEPADIAVIFDELRDAHPRPDVELHEIPAPGRSVAPYGLAFEAELLGDNVTIDPLVTGRFVVLHDPAGKADWAATTRIIILVQGSVDEVTGGDPLLPEVTWSWLQESLEGRGVVWHGDRGTVTRTASSKFGQLPESDTGAGSGSDVECDVELRASWSPADEGDLLAHLGAFCDLLGAVAGVPPPGVMSPVVLSPVPQH